MRLLTLSFSFLFCFLISCQKGSIPVKNTHSHSDSLAKAKKERHKFPDVTKFKSFLDEYTSDSLNQNTVSYLTIGHHTIHLDSFTLNVYKANNNKGFWNDSAKCHRILTILKDSRYDGLLPEEYGIPILDSMFKACFIGQKKGNDTLYWRLELEVTKNYLRYLKHLRFGKTDPESIFKEWDYKREQMLYPGSAEFSTFLIQTPDKLLNDLRPQFPLYNKLRAVLYKIDTIGQGLFEWDAIPYIGKDLKPGDSSWVIVKVKQRLLSLGLGEDDSITTVFGDDLLTAINYFQTHVGLTPNGKIDKATIAKLNFTLAEIEDVVRVNMERCRWLGMKGKLSEYYIIVNIADYNLRIYKNKKLVYKTKVVVGAINKKTPLFRSQMTTIEINPYWTVPASIIKEEILPRLKVDPDYLNRNNMELLANNSVVQITDFSSYSKGYFPFVIRQKPGKNNSLGQVKFLFPNPYSVYLHDTPSKSLFERDVRAFSHGCIRVSQPLKLAAFLLADQGFTPKQIDEIVKSGKNTALRLKPDVPIVITYWTCFSDEKNNMFFLKDIYGRDKRILIELNKVESKDNLVSPF